MLLRRPLDELVGPRLALLHESSIGTGHVEHRPEFAVATALLVVRGDAMTHELAEDEDGRGDEVGEGGVLERRAVAIAHQVVDETPCRGGIAVDILEGLFALRGHPGRPDDVRVARGGLDEFHRDVTAELDGL